jgi:hypothetical protein
MEGQLTHTFCPQVKLFLTDHIDRLYGWHGGDNIRSRAVIPHVLPGASLHFHDMKSLGVSNAHYVADGCASVLQATGYGGTVVEGQVCSQFIEHCCCICGTADGISWRLL